MHICFLTHEYPKENLNPGGVGVFLKMLAPRLVESGHSVTILGVNNLPFYEENIDRGVKIIRFERPNLKGLNWFIIAKKLNHYLNIIHKSNPIHVVEGAEFSLAFVKKFKNIAYLIRLHGGHYFFAQSENRGINLWKGFLERRSFSKADALIAVSDYVLSHTSQFHDFSKVKVKTIRLGVDLEKFKPITTVSCNPFSLVFVGTICEKKGVGNLVFAFDKVLKKFPQAKLSIYGKDWFYPNGISFSMKIKKWIKELGLEDKIYVYGPVPHEQIPYIYALHEYCIFPSFMETQGLVALEAMAMEKVVIFTKYGPGPETIIDGENGYLCNPLSILNISETIIKAFQNKANNLIIGQKARKKILESFNPAKIVPLNLDFYEEALNE
jgi:glycosyltransferase involved in cell wall biosynthesis